MPQPPFIQLVNVTKIFGKNIVLEGLNLEINYGEILGIIGKSGSGKTTLLNLVIGFLKADKGEVIFQSRKIEKDVSNVNMQFGFSSQESSFYDKLSVEENLQYFDSLYKIDDNTLKKRITELLNFVGLEDYGKYLAINLSAGMKKRLDIACSLVHDPKILILDEPTSDLDPYLRRDILKLLKKINKEKSVTIAITSHLLDELDICDKIAILDNKKIITKGSSNELKDKYTRNMEIILETSSGNYGWLEKSFKNNRDASKTLVKDGKFILYTDNAESVLKEVLGMIKDKNEKLLDIDVNKPSLNEVFEYFIDKDKEEALLEKRNKGKKNVQNTGDNKEES